MRCEQMCQYVNRIRTHFISMRQCFNTMSDGIDQGTNTSKFNLNFATFYSISFQSYNSNFVIIVFSLETPINYSQFND